MQASVRERLEDGPRKLEMEHPMCDLWMLPEGNCHNAELGRWHVAASGKVYIGEPAILHVQI